MSEAEMAFFQGQLVRLVVPVPGEDGILVSDWTRDSEYWRLGMAEPARFRYPGSEKKWLEDFCKTGYPFMIVTLADHRMIGGIGLEAINHASGHAWLSVGIGEREYWGKHYGSEAIELILDYAFLWLNLHRISLNVFEYNSRGIHAYEKIGFTVEGRKREALLRDGRRWDILYMGILKDEWLMIKKKKVTPDEFYPD